MPKPSHRERILDAGLRVMFRKGYVGSGVRDIAAEAAVPQGSFTNHFRSKEAFAAEVLDRYFAQVKELMAQSLGDTSLTPRQRLVRYLDLITDRLVADGCARGCLIGDLSLEAPGHSETLRLRLVAIFDEWQAPFAECIAEAQAAGEIPDTFPPAQLADFLLTCWEGAILRMKLEGARAPLDRFRSIAFHTVFKEIP
ncbi:MAG TPA: TetR family transcriptional regulator C-terminal domain-containing protein [Kribbellaceae bacterium]|jgi:TetR/AcrR family transcriptional repressor of nem operon